MEHYKDVLVDGLPCEDGAYEVILNGMRPRKRFLIRYTQSNGNRIWAGGVGSQVPENQIMMYRRVRAEFDSNDSGSNRGPQRRF
jgi:hypothetical protein